MPETIMSYSVVVFDVDGTLLDTREGVLAAVKHVIKTQGLGSLSEDVLRSFIGPPIQDSFGNAFGVDSKEAMRLAGLFRDYYKSETLFMASPYAGILDCCVTLWERDVRIAMATYKREDYAIDILRYFGFGAFDAVMHGSDLQGLLSKTDIIRRCLDDLGLDDYQNVLMVGDSAHDALGAAALEVDFLAVTYGFGFANEADARMYPCVGVVDSANSIASFILGRSEQHQG
jgi:phosphoglycolate phosphatase